MTKAASRGALSPARIGLLLGLVGWAFGVAVGQLGLWKHFDAPLYDRAVRASESPAVDPRVAAVYVGDPDIAAFRDAYGRWPWRTRDVHAVAAEVITEAGATVIGYDIIFSEPSLDEEGSDENLMIALASAPSVVHGVLFRTGGARDGAGRGLSELAAQTLGADGGTFGATPEDWPLEGHSPDMPIDPLLEASSALGHLNPSPDHDYAIRRVPLFVRMEGRLHPSLPLRMVMAAFELTEDDIEIDLGAREVRISVAADDVIRVPVNPDGTLWVHYDRPKDEIPAVLYSELDAAREQGVLDGAMIVVGVSVTAVTDTWKTPVDQQHQGFMIHGQVLENLLTRRFVTAIQPDRYPFGGRELTVHVLLLLACLGVGLLVARLDPRIGWPTTLAVAAAPIASCMLWLIHGDTWLTPTTATASLGAVGVLGLGYRQFSDVFERRRLRRVYERYLSPAVLDAVLRDPELVQLGGARKELSIFFSDIRGFTAYSETVEPVELTERLNEYYVEMIGIAHGHGATVDKLIGDSLMTFYGDPVAQPDHALRAVRTATDTQARLAELAEDWTERGVYVFRAGIGIATGEVAVGNLGSETFVDYTVMGHVVNLAARLCAAAGPGEILIGPHAHESVKHEFETESLGPKEFKGIAGAHEIFRVLRARTAGR